jgi:hypothetical protein
MAANDGPAADDVEPVLPADGVEASALELPYFDFAKAPPMFVFKMR